MKLKFLFAAIGALAAQNAWAEGVCTAHENGGALDFWLGEWRVTSRDGEILYGTNRVEKALQGCAVFEHWRSERGGEGKSLFFFDAANGGWEQIWVTTDTARPGGLKHKKIAPYDGTGVRFQGEYADDNGETILDRTTLTSLADGAVRQHIEISRDGGETWNTAFDALYAPAAQ